jgi:HNH endonuclease/Homing endonuclease associated repeat
MPDDIEFRLVRFPRSPATDEEIISDIRRVAKLVAPNAISFRAYSKLGKYHPSTAALRFGTWNKAIVAAGMEIGFERNVGDEPLFENLMRLWEYYGRQPRVRELTRPPSEISYGPYERRFHSWTSALEQFVTFANSKGAQPPNPIETVSDRRPGRSISLRTRFRVLKRDNFTCRACGASPALKPGLSLHVDHIKAWSLGGESVEENLQTLCEACNLGKSNVL